MERYLSVLREKRGFYVSVNGDVYSSRYYIFLISCIIAIMLVYIWKYILQTIPYYDVTIFGGTSYSNIIAGCLSDHDISFVFCRREIEQSCLTFSPDISNININVPFTPLTKEELIKLSEHTSIHINILDNLQQYLHKGKLRINTFETNNIIKDMEVSKVAKNLYSVVQDKNIWLTKLVITDKVLPLSCGDILVELVGKQGIHNIPRSYIPQNQEITMIFESRYFLDYYSDAITISSDQDLLATDFYSLQKPREFTTKNNILTIHPFHLTRSFDPLLTINTVVLSKLLQ